VITICNRWKQQVFMQHYLGSAGTRQSCLRSLIHMSAVPEAVVGCNVLQGVSPQSCDLAAWDWAWKCIRATPAWRTKRS
jgi:hypothetical protein